MTSKRVVKAIENALNVLYEANEMMYDYWVSELFDENWKMIEKNWNEETLFRIETDVYDHEELIYDDPAVGIVI
jgi:hypothetical protein